MEELPMAPSCALDESGLREQLARYRAVGHGARLLERTPRRLVVEIDGAVEKDLVEEVLAVERECCPFFTLDWMAEARRFVVSVSTVEHEPALDAIAFALDVKPVRQEGSLPATAPQ
jgi:hypothetical protein